MKSIRVAIFDDNAELRDSFFNLIDSSEGFICTGIFANCENILQNMDETRPDVVLMDIEMPGMSGIDAVTIVKQNFPDIKILMQTIFEDDDKVFQSICNGAEGYILKNTPPEDILESLKEIYEGGAPMTPAIATRVLRMFKQNLSGEKNKSFDLSPRETEVLKCLVEGMSFKLIADACLISIETVGGHMKNIYKKLQVHSKSEAVAKAIKSRIV